MHRLSIVIAFLSLTIHAAVIRTASVDASDGSCTASGADGCSCQPFSCNATNTSITCRSGELWDESSGCTEGGPTDESSYETVEGGNATVCNSSGPLVGAGCSEGTSVACKKLRQCSVGADGYCEDMSEVEAGFFQPCTPNL